MPSLLGPLPRFGPARLLDLEEAPAFLDSCVPVCTRKMQHWVSPRPLPRPGALDVMAWRTQAHSPKPPWATVHFTPEHPAPQPRAAGTFQDGRTPYQGSVTVRQGIAHQAPQSLKSAPCCALRSYLSSTWTSKDCPTKCPALPWVTMQPDAQIFLDTGP